ncbi:MAG TPA: hypothetical protein VNF93_02470 [Buchnera sp. (in: enterobacteria)]|nr:hypothetical protein [Buchnera sp. (in: enterobacteria)]
MKILCKHGINIKILDCEICNILKQYINDLFLLESLKLKINNLEEEIKQFKNKKYNKCDHGIEKHIECKLCENNNILRNYKPTSTICDHNIPIGYLCVKCNDNLQYQSERRILSCTHNI